MQKEMQREILNAAQDKLKHQRAHEEQVKVMEEITNDVREHGTMDTRHDNDVTKNTELLKYDDTSLQEPDRTIEDATSLELGNERELPAKGFGAHAGSTVPSESSSNSIDTDGPWQGCMSLICPPIRFAGDDRKYCSAVVTRCQGCGINVCPDCWEKNPQCDCSYCEDNHHCPNCLARVGSEKCRKAEELEYQRQQEELAQTKEAAASSQVNESGDVEEVERPPPAAEGGEQLAGGA
ncbi:MAG: hypothetical protein Q9222_004959 [Ikaeria aurantiellina]